MKRTPRQLKIGKLKNLIMNKGEVRQESLFKTIRRKGMPYSRTLFRKDLDFLERTNFIEKEDKLIKFIRGF